MEAVSAALNDPERSLIGDPRQGVYSVSLTSNDMTQAMQLARQIARIGIVPTTTIEHNAVFGDPIRAHVKIWSHTDQKELLEIVGAHLSEPRQQQLSDLVRARGPATPEILQRTWDAHKRGWSSTKIARKMNEAGIIDGMGGKHWTPKKVNALLEEYRKQHPEAAQPTEDQAA